MSKTDEDNIENIMDKVDKYSDCPYYTTVKMEGQSATYILEQTGKFHVCSRNCLYSKKVDNNYWTVAMKYNIEDVLRRIQKERCLSLAVQGEICGPSIQNNIYGFNTLHFYVFNMKDLHTGSYLSLSLMSNICKDYGLPMVPLLDTGKRLGDFINENTLNDVRENLVEKLGFIPKDDDLEPEIVTDRKIDSKKVFHCEGIVIRTTDMHFSAKLKSKEYALWFSGKD